MDDRHSVRQMMGTFLFLLTGPILWAAQLTAIYGAQSSLCAFAALPQHVIGGIVLGISVLVIIASALTLLWPGAVFRLLTGTTAPEDQSRFLFAVMRLLGALSTLAMVYFALAVAILPGCADLR